MLFDLPLNPALLEQRIGRLDRIGQKQTIQIHLPFLEECADARIIDWYHRGLDAIETPLQGGDEYQRVFKERLLALALDAGKGGRHSGDDRWDAFVDETARFRRDLSRKLANGRDRLLELHSFDRTSAEKILDRIHESDADPFPRAFLWELLEHFGVAVKEHEGGDVFLDPSHAFVESFPSLPRDGMLATFDRGRAVTREDIRFLSADHPLLRDALDLLLNAQTGTAAFGILESDTPNILLEAVFVLEAVAPARWQIEQFLPPVPLRVLVDIRGNDLTETWDPQAFAKLIRDDSIHRFLERPGFTAELLKTMADGASRFAEERSRLLKRDAGVNAQTFLQEEIQRLADLAKINENVRPAEIALAQERLARARESIEGARLRLDSLRLVAAQP